MFIDYCINLIIFGTHQISPLVQNFDQINKLNACYSHSKCRRCIVRLSYCMGIVDYDSTDWVKSDISWQMTGQNRIFHPYWKPISRSSDAL